MSHIADFKRNSPPELPPQNFSEIFSWRAFSGESAANRVPLSSGRVTSLYLSFALGILLLRYLPIVKVYCVVRIQSPGTGRPRGVHRLLRRCSKKVRRRAADSLCRTPLL